MTFWQKMEQAECHSEKHAKTELSVISILS